MQSCLTMLAIHLAIHCCSGTLFLVLKLNIAGSRYGPTETISSRAFIECYGDRLLLYFELGRVASSRKRIYLLFNIVEPVELCFL